MQGVAGGYKGMQGDVRGCSGVQVGAGGCKVDAGGCNGMQLGCREMQGAFPCILQEGANQQQPNHQNPRQTLANQGRL